ncbi:MAG: lipid-A-disaccharide synthase [Chthoniobacteraceae bacterium]
MKLYLVAGEASGDARGEELMRSLREQAPGIEFFGAGGPQMRALAGGEFFDWAHEAVVGLWDVLKKYGYFRAQFRRMLDDIDRVQPDALILIDYPGFNHRLAKAARVRRPAMKIIDYISPQVWAWNRGRIPEMAKYLDLMLCIFPFEKPLYEASGLRTEFVGHPMLDSLAAKRAGIGRESDLVALLPGSRGKEVRRIFPAMLDAARLMRRGNPALRFASAAASDALAREMRALAGDVCEVSTGNAHDLMQRATAGMVCSGTATLEAAYFGLPMVILYKVAWLTWVVGRQLVRVPHLGMPNILAGREIAREFLQGAAQPQPIAEAMRALVGDAAARTAQQRELTAVIAQLGEPGAGGRAAACILRALSSSS